jgi:hypothetical protein
MPNYNHNWLDIGVPRDVMPEVIAALGSRAPDAGKPVMEGEGLLEFDRLLPLPADLPDEDYIGWTGDNWGTTGPAMEVMRNTAPGKASATFYFVTAYTPPLEVIDHLAARWPTLGAYLTDVSFDDMVGGIGRWEKGRRLSYDKIEGTFDEIMDFFKARGEEEMVMFMRSYWLDESPDLSGRGPR